MGDARMNDMKPNDDARRTTPDNPFLPGGEPDREPSPTSEGGGAAPAPFAELEDHVRPGGRVPASEHGETWERPEPVERDRHVKAWMLFLGIVLLLVAFFQPLKIRVRKAFFKPPATSPVRTSSAFVALAYNGVEEAPPPGSPNVSTDMFKEQMRMLAEGGYNPVTLEDVRAFYKEGKLLPHKAVLITFEQAKRGTYNAVREILQARRWPAVMGVNTLAVTSMNQETLVWHHLREMKALGFWDLAAESALGFSAIETAPYDAAATFFTSPMWLPGENRYETREEFEKRVAGDHASVIADFEAETQSRPVAFFFPLGNYGQYDERAQTVRAVNLRQVEKHYDLGFVVGMLALNTESSDPRRLNRLLVNPSWSPNAFISMVDAFWPRPWSDAEGRSATYNASAWLGDWGEVVSRNDVLILKAVQPLDALDEGASAGGTTGAKAWLIGSDTFKDGTVSFLFNMRHGRFGVYLRSTNRGEYVFVGIDERGYVSARQKLQDVDELILGMDTLATDVSTSHNLAVTLRDNLMFVHVDGKLMFGGRVLLRGTSHSGLVGASVWDALVGVASTEIIATRISGRRDAIVTWSPASGRNIAHLNGWLAANAHRFAILAPPWIDIAATGPAVKSEWDVPSIALLASSNAARILPRLRIVNPDALLRISETDIAAKLRQRGAAGVFIDAAEADQTRMPQIVAWLTRLNDLLVRDGLALALRLPPGSEKLATSINIAQILAGVTLAGDNLDAFNLPADRSMPLVSVPDSEANATVQYYYQVANVLAEAGESSEEARNEDLRQSGFEAFAAADYAAAAAVWSQWSARDPENPEPLSLMGDAFLRNGDKAKAAEQYAASLAKNPGQINLAVRYTSLLFEMGRAEESNKLLDTYARTFPGHPEIAIAQARRLADSRRRDEAREIMTNLVEADPQNIEARLVLQNFLDEPAARYANMHQLLAVGGASQSHLFGLAQDIVASELLTIPESTIFFPFIRDTAVNGPNMRTQAIYESLLPMTNAVVEDFAVSPLSDAWTPWNGLYASFSGKYELNASASVSEAFLRLKKSELLRDGVITVTIDESAGAFWLYARRSSRAMLRFGYDNDGFIRLQTWYDGRLRTNESQPWLRPPGKITLSLEVRGDGAMGFQNGRPMFNTRIRIPREVCYGWWSIAPYSPNLGSAKASILGIEFAPLPSGIALIPPLPLADIPPVQEILRQQVRDLSAVAPVAFIQHPNGSVPTTPDIDLAPYKLFCSFHRLRLMPVVELPYFSIVKPAILADIIRNHHFEGIVVRVTSMPPKNWFAEMATELETTPGNLIVVQSTQPLWPPELDTTKPTTPEEEFVRLRGLADVQVVEIPRGNLLFPPIRDTWSLSALPAQEWAAWSSSDKRADIAPHLVVAPSRGLVPEANLESVRAQGVDAFAKRPSPIGLEPVTNAAPDAVNLATNGNWPEVAFRSKNDRRPAPPAATNAVPSLDAPPLAPAPTAPAATNAVPSLDAPPPAPAPTAPAATNAVPSLMTPPPAPALAAPVSTNAADRSNPLWKALEMPSTP